MACPEPWHAADQASRTLREQADQGRAHRGGSRAAGRVRLQTAWPGPDPGAADAARCRPTGPEAEPTGPDCQSDPGPEPGTGDHRSLRPTPAGQLPDLRAHSAAEPGGFHRTEVPGCTPARGPVRDVPNGSGVRDERL